MKKFFEKKFRYIFVTFLIFGVAFFLNKDLNNWVGVFVKENLPEEIKNKSVVSVHFLNVGRADSILISHEDDNVLIDAADKDQKQVVKSYLEKKNVKKLNLAVVTHPHRDHIGQMHTVVDSMDVDRFIMPKAPKSVFKETKVLKNLLSILDRKKILKELPQPGSNFTIGNMKFEIFAPNGEYKNINNYSIVMKLTYGQKKFLFTGDAEKESEKDMLNKNYDLKSDVLKVAHHGSRTSSTDEFLNAVDPKYGVISVKEDRMNLPNKDVLNRLSKHNIEILRTDKNGNIVISTDGEILQISKDAA